MKRLVLVIFFLASLGAAQAQTEVAKAAQPAPEVLNFRETEFDFGKIPQGKPVYYTFEIRNTGNKPIKLDNVSASCGCTTPEWSREEIPAGAVSKIKVGYNAATDGYFEKYITVTYNGSASKQIKIKGNVWKAPAGAAPANASVQFLKQQIQ